MATVTSTQLMNAFKSHMAKTMDAPSLKLITPEQWGKMLEEVPPALHSQLVCTANLNKVDSLVKGVTGGQDVNPTTRLSVVSCLRSYVVEHNSTGSQPDMDRVRAGLAAVGLHVGDDQPFGTAKEALTVLEQLEKSARSEVKKRAQTGGKEGDSAPPKKIPKTLKEKKEKTEEKKPQQTLHAFFKCKKLNDLEQKKVSVLHAVRKHVLRAFVTSVDSASLPTTKALVEGIKKVIAEHEVGEPMLEAALDKLLHEAPSSPAANAQTEELKQPVVVEEFDPTDEASDLPPPVRDFMHALLTALNTLEGFQTPPAPPPKTEKQILMQRQQKEKRKAREDEQEAARKKKLEAKEREKDAREKAKEAAKGPIEDMLVPDLKPLPSVNFSVDEFGMDQKAFLSAVTVWTLLHSAPKQFKLSRMSLTQFLQALQTEGDTVIMEHTMKGLLEANGWALSSGPAMATRYTAAAKAWICDVIDFFAEDVGMSKTKVPGMKSGKKEESSSDSSSSSGSDSSSDNSSSEEEEEEITCDKCNKVINQKAVVAECTGCQKTFHLKCIGLKRDPGPKWRCAQCPEEEEEEEEAIPKEKTPEKTRSRSATPLGDEDECSALIAVVTAAQQLGSYCSWPNFTISQRLVMLTALANRALETSKLCSYFTELRETLEKQDKDISNEEDPGKRFDLEHKAFLFAERLDAGGGIIRPLGWDRYRRLYWRFPMDKRVFVQTTSDSLPVPASASPPAFKASMLFDVEESEVIPQTAIAQEWGTLPWSSLKLLMDSLTERGVRESALKKNMERLMQHVEKEYPIEKVPEEIGYHMTRSRIAGSGYVNRLR